MTDISRVEIRIRTPKGRAAAAAQPRTSIFAEAAAADYVRYRATLQLEHWVMGGVPKKADVIEGWLRAKAGISSDEEVKQATKRTLQQLYPDLVTDEMTYDQAVEATGIVAEEHVNTFVRSNDGLLCLEERQVKAMLKEAINIRFPRERWGHGKGAKNFSAERVFVEPRLISLGVTEPSGRHAFVGHVADRLGERSTLTYFDFVDQPVVEFDVLVQSTAEKDLNERTWPLIWITAERNGLGALRSQGFGRFAVIGWEAK